MNSTNCDKFYIDGAWVDAVEPAGSIPVINPATEEEIGSVLLGGVADVERAVAAARRAFARWSVSPVEDRLALLRRILGLLEQHAGELATTITSEMGCAATFCRASQVPLGLAHVQAAIEVLETFEFTRRRGHTAFVREPIGVCGLITPWNWPLYQVTAKVAPALAAGCTVVLKPSELSPISSVMIAELLHEAGVPAGVFNMVMGSGPVVGTALASHPEVDMVSITGSTRAGVLVAEAAAPTVKRVTQELGGKSPNVLLDDADFERVVPLGVLAGMRNGGQSCSAPTRMLVPASRLAEVEALAAAAAANIIVGDPTAETTVIGPSANRPQYEKVQAMIASGIAEGAKLVCGGPGRPDGLDRGFFSRPTVFSGVTSDMRIAREEIFGPVLCIMAYEDEADAVRIANDTVYGLSAHVQSADLERARRVARQIRSGQVHLNHPDWDRHASFGGYKQSGNGREYGLHGFEEYLEIKSILGYFPDTEGSEA